MAASYPAGFDTMSDPSTNLSGPPLHSTMHNQINDVIEAIEAELGLNPSGADATVAATLAALSSRYAPLAATPRGRVASHVNLTSQAGFGTGGAAISTTVTFTFDVARWVEIVASIPVSVGATATVAHAVLSCSGGVGVLDAGGVQLRSDGGSGNLYLRWMGNISSGSKVLSITLSSNVGTVAHSASATSPSILSVVDLGV